MCGYEFPKTTDMWLWTAFSPLHDVYSEGVHVEFAKQVFMKVTALDVYPGS